MTGKKILIVEDNELNMKLFHDLLEVHGYATLQTKDGREALELARGERVPRRPQPRLRRAPRRRERVGRRVPQVGRERLGRRRPARVEDAEAVGPLLDGERVFGGRRRRRLR